MISNDLMPNVNKQYHRGKIASLCHNMQRKIDPVAPKTVEDLDITLRTDPFFRSIACDCDKNSFYDKLLYSEDHNSERPSHAMAFVSYSTLM